MIAATRHPERPHLEANRIAGLAAAITLNIGLFMLLVVPMHAPPVFHLPDTDPIVDWIKPKPLPPPPPPTVPIAKVTPHAPVAQPTTQRPPVEPTTSEITVDHSTLPIPGTTTNTANSQATLSKPLPGMRLDYAFAPAPDYPRDALREGVAGTVLLQVLVDVDGRPLQVDIQRSSGDRRLDIAARRQVLQHWRFRPAMKDGRAVQAIGIVPIAFDLHD